MDDSLGPFKGNCLFVIDLDKGVDRIAKLARGVETGAAQEIAEIEERIARYVRMLAQEAGEGGIGGKVGLVGEKGRVVRQHDLEVGRRPAEQADELGFGSVGVRLFGHGRGRLRQSGGGQHRGK